MSRPTRRQAFAAIVVAACVICLGLTFRLTIVRGDSMLPTYRDGQMVIVNRLFAITGPLRRGDVVLVRTANDILIKRIAYLPGDVILPPDSIAFRHVTEYFEADRRPGDPEYMAQARLKVPAGFVVVLGDNRAVSEDSRMFGPIAVGDILGRVVNAPAR